MALLSRRSPIAGFMQLGTIYKGAKKANGTVGKDLDYFRFEPKTFAPELRNAWNQYYGDRPTKINFRVLSDTPEEIFDPFFCQFQTIKSSPKGRKVLECDGINIIREMDNKTQQLKRVDKPCMKSSEQDHCDKCKPSGVLKLIIPELWSEGFMGYVDIGIKSEYELSDIPANLEGIFVLLTGLNIPLHSAELILQRGDRVVNTKFFKDGSWIPKVETKSLVSIALNPDYLKKIIDEQSRRGNELFGRSQSALPGVIPQIEPTNIYSVPVEAISEPMPKPILDAKQRIFEVCDRLGILPSDRANYFVEAKSKLDLEHLKADTASTKDIDNLIVQILIDWGLEQNVWNHDNHCTNSFQKVLDECKGVELSAIASFWFEKIQVKLNNQTIEAPVIVEPDNIPF